MHLGIQKAQLQDIHTTQSPFADETSSFDYPIVDPFQAYKTLLPKEPQN